MIALGYIGVFLVGFVLGLLGGGGSILSVPVLTYLFAMKASLATVYSLFLVGISSLVGVVGYLRKGLVDFSVGAFFLVPSVLGVALARRAILPALPDEAFRFFGVVVTKDKLILLAFASVMLLAAYSMLKPSQSHERESRPRRLSLALWALAAGVVMGFVGAGGGFLVIPVLVTLGRIEMKRAIGTSLFIIAVSSLSGFATDAYSGARVNWGFLLPLSLLSLSGVLVGARLSRHVSGERLKRIFAILILAIALVIVGKELL